MVTEISKMDIPVKITKLDVYDLLASGKKCIGIYWERLNGETGKYTLMFNPNNNELTIDGLSNKEDNEEKVFLKALFDLLLNKIEVVN